MYRLLLLALLAACAPSSEVGAHDTGADTGAPLTVADGCTGWLDEDGDGYGDPHSHPPDYLSCDRLVDNEDDCNDWDPSTHPGAIEVCNGVDDNCDGQADEGLDRVWYRDADGDGFGDPGDTVAHCWEPASGYVLNGNDCDDTDEDAYPGNRETCGDRVDNDCDGQIDEGC